MSLIDALAALDDGRSTSAFDDGTGCYLSRNGDGDLQLSVEGSGFRIVVPFAELAQGPGAGLTGRRFETAVRRYMRGLLKDAQKHDESAQSRLETGENAQEWRGIRSTERLATPPDTKRADDAPFRIRGTRTKRRIP